MTISSDEIREAAPDVASVAHERGGLENPFISFKSLESLCRGDETLDECLRDFVMYSLRYTETVCLFERIINTEVQADDVETKAELARVRKNVHEATMVSINVLIRALKATGTETPWAQKLVTGGRAAYAKFAILTAFEFVLQERNGGV